MNLKIFDFARKMSIVKNYRESEVINSVDYFEYYTTGIEDLVDDNFFATDRYVNERSEVMGHNLLGNQDFADVIVAANNDNFLWDAPMDYDKTELVIDNRINTLEKYMQRSLSDTEKIYHRKKFREDSEQINDDMTVIVLPRYNRMQEALRKIRRYLNNRKVK